jgi:peptidoglycan/LPS O-acetylase OafA/YrhL
MRRLLPLATAVLAMACALAAAGGPAAYAGTLAGNDVSYPQCGQALPSGQAFGIVAVNEGLPNNTNPAWRTK